MKKVLAWVLALALVLSTFAMSFATYTDDAAVKAANCEEAVAVLSALGVITGYDDGSFKPANDVTRAEMAALIIREMGFSDVQKTGYENDFVDVAKNSWAAGVIQKAVELGLMKGYPDGTFKPAQNVTYNEALTMIVRALGYKDEDLTGSWPQSHVNQARTLDLAKGVSVTERNFQEPATRGDCAIMLYNALELPMVSSQATNLPVEDTFLARLADLLGKEVKLNVEGVVQMCDIAQSAVLGEELLGAPITAMTFDGVVASINSVDAEKYEVSELKDKKLKEKSKSPVVFYNGYLAWNLKNMPKYHYDEYVWANVDGNYYDVKSTLYWQATSTFQWTKDLGKKLARGDFNNKFITDKYDAIDTKHFFLKGADSLDKIADGSIVTIYSALPLVADGFDAFVTSEDALLGLPDITLAHRTGKITQKQDEFAADVDELIKKSVANELDKISFGDFIISKVEVGTKTVEGTVSERSVKNNTVKIDDTDYSVAVPQYCVFGFDKQQLAGKTGTFYLNYKGEIAKFEAATDKKNYAIYLNGKVTKDGNFFVGEKEIKSYAVELFTAAGEDAWFPVVDGVFEGEGDLVKAQKDDPKPEPGKKDITKKGDQLVEYGLDSENAITRIGFIATSTDKAEVKDGTFKDGEKTYPVSDDVVVFTKDAYIDGDWTVTEFADLEGKTLAKEVVPSAAALEGPGPGPGPGPAEQVKAVQYILEGNVVVAIAYDGCVADEATQYIFIDFENSDLHVTSGTEAHAIISFVGVEGEFKTIELNKGDFDPVFGLAKVTFESNGEIKSIEPAKAFNGYHFYAEDQVKQGQQYLVDFANPANYYNVTGANYYERTDSGVIVSDLDQFAKGDRFVLFDTDEDGVNDIVLIIKTAL